MISAHDILASARARTGLSDIGDPAIMEGLERLLASYSDEAGFTERGLQMAHGDLVTALAIRMKIEAWLKDHPELLDAPIDRPLFVFGLPRTGTTLLINLLHSDPARRFLPALGSLRPGPAAAPRRAARRPALPGDAGQDRDVPEVHAADRGNPL